MSSQAAWTVVTGDPRPVDYLAASGLVWVVALALCAVMVARRLGHLDRQLQADEGPRQRLAGIVHRSSQVLADPSAVQVALQPIVDLVTGRWVAAEALARFPDNAPVERWFAEAHEVGTGLGLERMIFHKAVAALPLLPPDVRVSVNASPALIVDPAFDELLRRLGHDRARLTVEITEHAAVAGYEHIRAALLPHREVGLRLAVDDTGAGYASFAHVLRLRPDVIKLDRSLLTDIDHDPARRAFVTAIVLMALELGASVTGEGVETASELELLRSLGVDAAQGFLLARPSSDEATWRSWARRDWLTHTTNTRGPVRVSH